jgi:beta-glucosidase
MRYIFLQLFLHAALGLVNTLSTADVFGDEKKDFMWGVATAAYQIEGATNVDGRGPSIWDTFSKLSGKINNGDNGDIADGSYTKFMEDIQLIKNMGLKSYRFSISWSRIMPTGEFPVNQAGIEHYNLVINELIAAGIAPLVTLYHWDLPEALDENYGGWLNPHMEDFFKRYADVCFRSFGDRVKLWLTLNEPWTFINMGYVAGIFAPGRCSDRNRCAEGNSSSEGYIAAHNALNAHAATVELYRTKYQAQQGGLIGIALNHDFGLPWSQSEADIAAAQIRNEFYIGWFADPIFYGKYPDSMIEKVGDRLPTFTKEQSDRIKGSVDFHAFNHYTSKYIYDPMNLGDNAFKLLTDSVPMGIGGWWDDQGVLDTKYSIQGNLIGTQGASTWLHVVPEGFYEVVMWNTRRYTVDGKKPVMFIMENGCDVPHENQMTMKEALNDTFRLVSLYVASKLARGSLQLLPFKLCIYIHR